MARPRKTANVLKFTGAFDKNPARAREDVQGAGEFNKEPPIKLKAKYHAAWHYLVERLPLFSFSSSDEALVAHTARLLAKSWEYDEHLDTMLKIHGPLMSCFQALGLSPTARTKMVDGSGSKGKKNRFQQLADEG